MLPRQYRLSNSRDIARVYKKGRTARSDLFRISWLENRNRIPRVAVVTSRKLSTKAVRRNLLKRQVRGIMSERRLQLGSNDLVIQILPRVIQEASAKRRDDARKAVQAGLTYEALQQDLTQLLKRSRLLQTGERGKEGTRL